MCVCVGPNTKLKAKVLIATKIYLMPSLLIHIPLSLWK